MVRAFTFTSPRGACAYLPDRVSELRYVVSPQLDASDYMHRLRHGWRRFGPVTFRPECPACRMCQSLRVPVSAFRPAESQRRAWKRNHDALSVRIGSPSITPAKVELFAKFHEFGHVAKGWPERADHELDLFTQNPFATEEWDYYVGDRLIAVGYVDALPDGLSAIYFFHDPAEGKRSLGTFNILKLIAAARDRGLPHVYLGYYVDGCRSLEYKRRFRPSEVLTAGKWEMLAR